MSEPLKRTHWIVPRYPDPGEPTCHDHRGQWCESEEVAEVEAERDQLKEKAEQYGADKSHLCGALLRLEAIAISGAYSGGMEPEEIQPLVERFVQLEAERDQLTKDLGRVRGERKSALYDLGAAQTENEKLRASLKLCRRNLDELTVDAGAAEVELTRTEGERDALVKACGVAEFLMQRLKSSSNGGDQVSLPEVKVVHEILLEAIGKAEERDTEGARSVRAFIAKVKAKEVRGE